jgi:acetyl-CoA carboxylase biotin carboxyl carrier protein
MKVMNEIKAEAAGRVRSVLADDGAPVEYGQILFILDPL